MIAQYIREEGFKKGEIQLLSRQIMKKYHPASEGLKTLLEGLPPDDLLDLGERIIDVDSFEELQRWIQQRKPRITVQEH